LAPPPWLNQPLGASASVGSARRPAHRGRRRPHGNLPSFEDGRHSYKPGPRSKVMLSLGGCGGRPWRSPARPAKPYRGRPAHQEVRYPPGRFPNSSPGRDPIQRPAAAVAAEPGSGRGTLLATTTTQMDVSKEPTFVPRSHLLPLLSFSARRNRMSHCSAGAARRPLMGRRRR
jgi:hypothetical protein